MLVDRTLAVPDYGNVWALGDCASVPDMKTGKSCPPTAQVATREAVVLAHNIRAYLLARPLKEFCFKSLGTLCIVGYHTACAEIRGRKFSGLFAWLLWRGIYLSKLPGLERKASFNRLDAGTLFPPKHSFTTKKDGHGFGLQRDALIAEELGGL